MIPDYWIWYGYLNPLRYAWGALMINCFEGRGVKVTGTEVRTQPSPGRVPGQLCAYLYMEDLEPVYRWLIVIT